MSETRTGWLITIGLLEISLILALGLVSLTPSTIDNESGFVVKFVTNISELPWLTVFLIFLTVIFLYIAIVGVIPTVNIGS